MTSSHRWQREKGSYGVTEHLYSGYGQEEKTVDLLKTNLVLIWTHYTR